MVFGGNKEVKQGEKEQGKYKPPTIRLSQDEQEVTTDRFVINIDERLIHAIEQHVVKLKSEGDKRRDTKTGRLKKINKSLWARDLFLKELKKHGINL